MKNKRNHEREGVCISDTTRPLMLYIVDIENIEVYRLEHNLGHFDQSILVYKCSDNFLGYFYIWHVCDILLYHLHIRSYLNKKQM